jgi:hypothetical protein
MWRRVSSDSDTVIIGVLLTNILDEIICMLEIVRFGRGLETVFFCSRRVATECENVAYT